MDAAEAQALFIAARWPEGVTCPKCGTGQCWPVRGRGLFNCSQRHQFSAISGTPLHRSHIALPCWLAGAALIIRMKARGLGLVTSAAMARDLGLSYATAHRMRHLLLQDITSGDLVVRALAPSAFRHQQ